MTKRIASATDSGQRCSIGRALEVVGDRWSLLILREAVQGVTRFSEFRERLHVASDVLTQRLGVLVDAGVLEKRPYREDGARTRMAYRLTPAGRDLTVVIGALQQWGDLHRPHPDGPLVHRASRATGRPLRVAFIDDEGNESPLDDVHLAARFDPPRVSETWRSPVVGPDAVREEALAATDREGPPVWLHGDLHPANIVAVDGTASGVVDFGDMRADDPLRGQREVSRPDLTEGDRWVPFLFRELSTAAARSHLDRLGPADGRRLLVTGAAGGLTAGRPPAG